MKKIETTEELSKIWMREKAREKQERTSLLQGLPEAMPGLAKAARLQDKAAKVGYDFPHRNMLFTKLEEELNEFKDELSLAGEDLSPLPVDIEMSHVKDEPLANEKQREQAEGELGDVLFVLANIARRWKINPEEALRKTNEKFTRRFQAIEKGLKAAGKSINDVSLQEMEMYYQAEKKREKEVS